MRNIYFIFLALFAISLFAAEDVEARQEIHHGVVSLLTTFDITIIDGAEFVCVKVSLPAHIIKKVLAYKRRHANCLSISERIERWQESYYEGRACQSYLPLDLFKNPDGSFKFSRTVIEYSTTRFGKWRLTLDETFDRDALKNLYEQQQLSCSVQ